MPGLKHLKKSVVLPADEEVFCGEEMKPYVALNAAGEIIREERPAVTTTLPNERQPADTPVQHKMEMPLFSWVLDRVRRLLGHSE